jgi:hypothetical protein
VRNERKLLAKHNGIKVWCYWEHVGEPPIGNFVKISWELYEKAFWELSYGTGKNPPKNFSVGLGSHTKNNF